MFGFVEPVDREGGMPLDLAVERLDASGFDGKRNPGTKKFFAPCVYYSSIPIGWDRYSSKETKPVCLTSHRRNDGLPFSSFLFLVLLKVFLFSVRKRARRTW